MRTDSLYLGHTSIRISQLLSLVFVIAALLYIAYARTKRLEKRPFPAALYEEMESGKKNK